MRKEIGKKASNSQTKHTKSNKKGFAMTKKILFLFSNKQCFERDKVVASAFN